jgi:microcystin-dependent protein
VASPFVGQIMTVPYNFAPKGWAFCNGQLLPIQQFTALFSLLGTYYGGNGQTTFALPDLQGRVPIHAGGQGSQAPGLSPYDLGQSGGEETVTLLVSEIPSHTHTVAPLASADQRTTDRPAGAYPSVGGIYAASPDSSSPLGPDATTAVGGQPHTNLQPFLTLNYVIALVGIYPSRS